MRHPLPHPHTTSHSLPHYSPDDHRSKRQFQPSITSFFARHDSTTDFTDDDLDPDWDQRGPGPITRAQQQHLARPPTHQSLAPSVPGHIQADLLSVGMRVRKSVPEGYKTSKTTTLPSIQTTLSSSRPGPGINAPNSGYDVKPPRDAVPDALQHQRELLPFCGLHKIGGYAEQPVTNVHLYGGNDASGERAVNIFPLPAEAFSQPFSSQASTDSTLSTDSLRPNPTNQYKRSWQDEDDSPPPNLNANFYFAIPMKIPSEDDVPISPLSESPAQSIHAFPQTPLRPFAQPKSRRQTGGSRMVDVDGAIFKESDVDMDENISQPEARVIAGSSSDFGEAEFLQPWATGRGREVRMGGV